jgi:adenosine deaminase
VRRGTPHPIHAFLEAGVPVAICCDNSTVSRTDQVRESLKVAERIGIEKVEAIHRDADAFSFIKPETALQEGE